MGWTEWLRRSSIWPESAPVPTGITEMSSFLSGPCCYIIFHPPLQSFRSPLISIPLSGMTGWVSYFIQILGRGRSCGCLCKFMLIQEVVISTLRWYCPSPHAAQERGVGFFHFSVYEIVGPLHKAPSIFSLLPLPLPWEIFSNLWGSKPCTYLIKHSHKSVRLFLHKIPFSLPLRVGLLNKSQKMSSFSL